MTQPKVWIVMATYYDSSDEAFIDKVFSSLELANDYVLNKVYKKTHYKTGRKRSPSRYLDGHWDTYEFEVS